MRTIFALLLFAAPLLAQTPYVVKDINTTFARDTQSSSPGPFVAWRNRTYFVATLEGESGTELWSTDGTAAGTAIVADILPGEASSNPAALTVVNDVLLFTARDVNHGIELWTTDGTAAGTKRLLDLNPGPNSAQPFLWRVDGSRLFFTADDGMNGRELWITDGTAAGTRLVEDVEPGPTSSSPRGFVKLGNSLYFLTTNSLWKTDGTEAGTVKVATVFGRNLALAGARIFFEGLTAETNWELWVSDGTEAGTRMLPEIRPGNQGAFTGSYPSGLRAFGNSVLFTATDGVHGAELWISDGTAAGTRMVRDLEPGAEGFFDRQFLSPVVFGNRAYFGAQHDDSGIELWSTDGTEAGTALFLDLEPGSDSSWARPLTVIGGKLLFTTEGDRAHLWTTDGTVSGTRVLQAADGTAFDYGYGPSSVVDGKFYFAGRTDLTGNEPWVTDGTDAGTRMIANLAKDGAPSSFPGMFTATDHLLFFHATEGIGGGSSLWRSDGTESGTFKLRQSGQHPAELTGAGPYVFFYDENNRDGLMLSDGTLEGTRPADELGLRFGGREIKALHPFGSTLFAAVNDGTVYDTTLWVTEAAPRARATHLGSTNPYGLVEVAGQYMFYAQTEDGVHDRSLWITDGTAAGTYPVIPDLESSYQEVSQLAAAGGWVYFASSDEGKTRLNKTDGSFDGTVVVKELPLSTSMEMEAAGDRVFLLDYESLWVSDGTAAGTVELAKSSVLSLNYDDLMQAVGNRVVFTQYKRDANTYELWGSDGTAAGTKFLRRLYTANAKSIDGVVYFAGTDDAHGTELWTTDGTLEGTKLFIDLNPGPASSYPSSFTKVGNTLYFSGYTDAVGDELWALSLTDPQISIADARARESASAVRFTVTLTGTPSQPVTLEWATSDGSARAGQDYEAASGTLTFAAGETTKTIDVRVLGDTAAETNEMFRLALRNVSGARVLKGDATGIVDDDDRAADLRVAVELGGDSFSLDEAVRVSNAGPSGATEVDVTYTSIPGHDQWCWDCAIPQIATGQSALSYPRGASTYSSQVYRSVIVTARQPDPNPSNNAVAWTVSEFGHLAMDVAFLTPGATATISARTDATFTTPVPNSSDPTVVSISSAVTKKDDQLSTFTVTGLKPGTSSITVGGFRRPLLVTVFPAGTTPRWPGAFTFGFDSSRIFAHQPLTLTVTPLATAPLNGATGTGSIVVTAGGVEIARHHVTGRTPVTIPLYFRTLGPTTVHVAYSGDANFLPQTAEHTVRVDGGTPAMSAILERVPDTDGTFRVRVRVEGAPPNPPAGTVSVFHHGNYRGEMTLTPSANGSTAEMTVDKLPESPTLLLRYISNRDSVYHSVEVQVTLPETRRRGVRH